MAFSRNFVYGFNIFTALLGLAIFAAATYVSVTYGYENYDAVISKKGVYIAMASGIMVVLVSFIGCYGAKQQKSGLLLIYVVIVSIALALQLAGAVLLLQYSGKLGESTSQFGVQASETATKQINNALLATYDTCCFDDSELCTPILCAPVLECGAVGANATSCFVVETGITIPPIAAGICTFLKTAPTLDGVNFIVGDPAVGNQCGGGVASEFMTELVSYASSKLYLYGIAFFVIVLFQFLALLMSCYLLFCAKKE